MEGDAFLVEDRDGGGIAAVERVAFLIEDTGERIGCLLNPESLVMRREAGIAPRRSHGGLAAGAELRDDPLICTGGGRTELELDLLFDVQLEGSSIETEDVRDLTRPLWDLAENAAEPEQYGVPRFARFVWGKAWNMPGLVSSVAERLEYFTAGGVPRRSWLRIRMLRAEPPAIGTAMQRGKPTMTLADQRDAQLQSGMEGGAASAALSGVESSTTGFVSSKRIDEEAYEQFGDARAWRLLADQYGGVAISAAAEASRDEPEQSEAQVPAASKDVSESTADDASESSDDVPEETGTDHAQDGDEESTPPTDKPD